MSITIKETVQDIPIEQLMVNPFQPETRITFPENVLKEFADSIKEEGIILKPVVRFLPYTDETGQYENHYQVGDGWLRISAARYLYEKEGFVEYETVSCIVRELTDRQMADMIRHANGVRKDMNPIEWAQYYKRYQEEFGVTQEKMAEEFETTQGNVANSLRLLDLPADIQDSIAAGELTAAHGRQLLRLSEYPSVQKKVLKDIIDNSTPISVLTKSITREIWDASKSLNKNSYYTDMPAFDVTGCHGCDRIKSLTPWFSKDEKEDRCTDPDCWKEKQAAFRKEARDQVKEEAKARGVDGKAIYKSNELTYGIQYVPFGNYQGFRLDKECKQCPSLAAMENGNKKPEPICMKPSCARKKQEEQQKVEETKKKDLLERNKNNLTMAVNAVVYPRSLILSLIEVVAWTSELASYLNIDVNEELIHEQLALLSNNQLLRLLLLVKLNLDSKWRQDKHDLMVMDLLQQNLPDIDPFENMHPAGDAEEIIKTTATEVIQIDAMFSQIISESYSAISIAANDDHLVKPPFQYGDDKYICTSMTSSADGYREHTCYRLVPATNYNGQVINYSESYEGPEGPYHGMKVYRKKKGKAFILVGPKVLFRNGTGLTTDDISETRQ